MYIVFISENIKCAIRVIAPGFTAGGEEKTGIVSLVILPGPSCSLIKYKDGSLNPLTNGNDLVYMAQSYCIICSADVTMQDFEPTQAYQFTPFILIFKALVHVAKTRYVGSMCYTSVIRPLWELQRRLKLQPTASPSARRWLRNMPMLLCA